MATALATALAGLPRDKAVRRLTTAGVPAAAARTFEDLLDDPAWLDHEVVHRHERPDGSGYVTAGRYAWFSRTQQQARLVAPGLGEHSRAVLTEAGVSEATVDRLVADAVVTEGAPMTPLLRISYR